MIALRLFAVHKLNLMPENLNSSHLRQPVCNLPLSARSLAIAMLPDWVPLFQIVRSDLPEVCVQGILAVSDAQGRLVAAAGDVNTPFWSRSTLKPWQLAGHYAILFENYPALQPQHFALMASSHNAQQAHLNCLQEIMDAGGLSADDLQCPAVYSCHNPTSWGQRQANIAASSLFNCCSAKHAGYVMAMKAQGLDFSQYLKPDGRQFLPTRKLLSHLAGRNDSNFATTIDGCRLPNYALTVRELALLYARLASGFVPHCASDEMIELCHNASTVGRLMRQYPYLIGGDDRLDTRIMEGALTHGNAPRMVAKEGADGLLATGVLPSAPWPDGLGIAIKLSSGYDLNHFEMIVKHIFERLFWRKDEEIPGNEHIKVTFHFDAMLESVCEKTC